MAIEQTQPRIVVIEGIKLSPPGDPRDCSCVFCSIYRTRHRLVRALVTTAFVPAAALVTLAVWNNLREGRTQGGGSVVGALWIVVTMIAALALATWYEPVRRQLHRRRPRSTSWPPED